MSFVKKGSSGAVPKLRLRRDSVGSGLVGHGPPSEGKSSVAEEEPPPPENMKLNVHVGEGDSMITFVAAVGEGNQTIRWLSMVAAQRFALVSPRGRVRQREGNKSPRGGFTPAALTSPRMSDDPDFEGAEYRSEFSDTFIEPTAQINSIFKHNEHVEVVLNTRGRAAVSRFHSHAFLHSAAGVEMRLQTEQRRLAQEEERQQKAAEETMAIIKKNAAILFGENEANNPALVETTDELKMAFALEWNLMETDHFVENQTELDSIREAMEHYYTPIRAVYKHYSGLGATLGDESHNDASMSFNEFSSFCHKVGIYDHRITETTLRKIFRTVDMEMGGSKVAAEKKTALAGGGGSGGGGGGGGDDEAKSAGGGSGSSPRASARAAAAAARKQRPKQYKRSGDNALTRPEFMESLIHLAMRKFEGKHGNNRALQFLELLDKHCIPYIKTLVRTDGRSALTQTDMAQLLIGYIDMLRSLYASYSASNHSRRSDATTMDAGEFETLCVDANLVSADGLTLPMVKDIFIDAQNEDLDTKVIMKEDYSNMTKMIFIEFVESLVYVAEVYVKDEDMTLVEKMHILLEKLKVLAVARREADAVEAAELELVARGR